MATINQKRMLFGSVVGGLVWGLWSALVNAVFLAPAYAQAQASGLTLTSARYPFFLPFWFFLLIVLTYCLTWFYTGAREAFAPGPRTALAVGILGGFLAGFPVTFSVASWMPAPRVLALGWLVDLWVGAVLATLTSAWLYREG